MTDIADQEPIPSDDTTLAEQHDPHQFDDAPSNESDPILDYINSQHHQEEDMSNALQAYNVMTFPTSDVTPHQSIHSVHIHLFYHLAQAKQAQHASLVDRGANGGLAGSDVRVLSKSSRKCAVTGIDQHQINGLDIVQCAALVKPNHGYVNLIMNEYAYYGKGHTIHSSGQIEWHKNTVDDKSVKVGGSQCITTLDGYSFPLNCTGGLMYLSILGKPTDEELVKYPSVHLTSIHEWDPSILDFSYPEGDREPVWAGDPQHGDLIDPNFDPQGLYTKRAINTLSSLADVHKIPPMAMLSSTSPSQACKHQIKSETPDFDKCWPYFGWVNADTIKETIKHTTQWGASINTFPMKRHLKSRNPALNVPRRHKAVTVYSDTPAIDSGFKMAQLFVRKESLVSDIYPMRSGKQFVNTLEDNIHRRGAMDKLISDSAKNEISHKVKHISRAYNINDWQSEPYHQNQNPPEWRYRPIKAWTNTIMNRTGAPAHWWLLSLQYVCYILNHISTASLGGQVPLQVLYGVTPDINILLLYTFYQPVFYATHDQYFHSDSEERAGFWVGFAEHCGDSLDAVTLKIIYRSALRPRTPKHPNKRLVDAGGEEDHQPHEKPTKHPTPVSKGRSQLNQILLLSILNQGMMIVQPQASLCQDSTLMTLLEGPFYYPLETTGRD